MSQLGQLLDDKNVLIVCGSGGVGKTTSSAAIAMQVALTTTKRVLVITVDPARRLADALGLQTIGNTATEVRVPGAKGTLHAAMLDAKQSWDELVDRHGPDEATKQKILSSPLYRNITERFVQSHDYIAMERLYDLHHSGDYDLIVIDTPPSNHAIDFLEAPDRMADFFDSRLLKFLIAPSKSKLTALASKPFLQIADRLLGQRFLADITDFFVSLETMRPGFIARAQTVSRLLKEQTTTFAVVTTLESSPRREAMTFMDELQQRTLHLGAVVLNRVLPDVLLDPQAAAAGTAMRANHELAASLAELGPEAKLQRVFSALADNFERFAALAEQERQQREAMSEVPDVLVTVPWFGDTLEDVDGLLRVGAELWK